MEMTPSAGVNFSASHEVLEHSANEIRVRGHRVWGRVQEQPTLALERVDLPGGIGEAEPAGQRDGVSSHRFHLVHVQEGSGHPP